MFHKTLKINGVEYLLSVNITGKGEPTIEAEPGMIYLDENTEFVYMYIVSGRWKKIIGEVIADDAYKIAEELKSTTIREIIPNEYGVFPIREPDEYYLHIEWEQGSSEEDQDMYNIFELISCNEFGEPSGMLPLVSRLDINSKYFDGVVTIPDTIKENNAWGIMVGGQMIVKCSMSTVNSFAKSTDRQINEVKTALGSYITDIDTLLGGE